MRIVTARETATLRAALRLWIDTAPVAVCPQCGHRVDAIPESVFEAAGDDAPLQDADAEHLLQLLSSQTFVLQLQPRAVSP